MSRTYELMQERRAERMRLGKAACTIIKGLPSDPEIQIALVPLTDAEYQNALERAANEEILDTQHGLLYKDRVQQTGVLLAVAREVEDLSVPFFRSFDEVTRMDSADINILWDHYREMMEQFSPSMDEMTEEEFEEVKKAFQRLGVNDLSGSAWYALRRFLLTVGSEPPQDRSPGFSSTPSSTTNSEEAEFTQDA